MSMSGSRVLEQTGAILTKSTPLDKYLFTPDGDNSSWYEYICKSGKVSVVSRGSVRASSPLSEDFCRTMLLMQEVKSDDTIWSAIFLKFIESEQCPFVKTDVKWAKRYLSEVADQETDSW